MKFFKAGNQVFFVSLSGDRGTGIIKNTFSSSSAGVLPDISDLQSDIAQSLETHMMEADAAFAEVEVLASETLDVGSQIKIPCADTFMLPANTPFG